MRNGKSCFSLWGFLSRSPSLHWRLELLSSPHSSAHWVGRIGSIKDQRRYLSDLSIFEHRNVSILVFLNDQQWPVKPDTTPPAVSHSLTGFGHSGSLRDDPLSRAVQSARTKQVRGKACPFWASPAITGEVWWQAWKCRHEMLGIHVVETFNLQICI